MLKKISTHCLVNKRILYLIYLPITCLSFLDDSETNKFHFPTNGLELKGFCCHRASDAEAVAANACINR